MKRILVIISNSDLKKKIISLSSKLQGSFFFFFSDIEDFIEEFQIIQPDVLIVGDKEYKSLANKTACHELINSISKFILASYDSKETLITSGLNPIILQPDFDIADFKQLITPFNGFNNQFPDEKQLEVELPDEKRYLQMLMDNIPDTIYFKDSLSKFTRINLAQAICLGIQSPDDAIGKTDFDFSPEEQASLSFQDEVDIMKTGKPLINRVEKVQRADGNITWVSTTKIPIKDQSGKITGIVGVSRDVTESHNLEMKLQREKNLLNGLLDNIPDLIYFKDMESRFIRVNKAHAKTIGVQNPKDAIGKTDADFFDKIHSMDAYSAEQEMMRTGESILNQLEHIKTTDGYRYVTSTKIPLKDDQGAIIGMVGVTRDVTKSHILEMKLQQETNLLNALLDSVPDSVYFKDKKSQFVRVSKSWLRKHNITNGDNIVGKTDADFMSAEFAKETYREEQIMMETGKPLINKLQSKIDAAGNQRYDIANKVPIFDHNNTVVGMVGISRDITDLKNTEFELNKEKELLKTLMDNIPDLIYFKDLSSKFIRINQAQSKNLGLQSPDEAIGKTDFDFSPKKQASLSFKDELDIMKSGEPLVNRVESVQRADGSIIWVSTTKIPVKDQFGKITGTVGMSRDITVLEKTRENLIYAIGKAEEANKAKSLFLANMSHEIRTPMNGVIGMADVLGQTALTDEQHEYLNIIIKSGNRLLGIINNILDFSKIESGSLELEKAPISIRQVIENVADILIITALNKGINLINYVDSSVPEIVEGDSVRLSQIMVNLVNNALKFTEHGEVYFTAELTESTEIMFKVLFKVKDNGIGISQEAQQKIFHSFTQADSSTTRKFGGTGLGLAISKRLVEMMGGTIGVESVEGEGSLFWFTAKFGISSEIEPLKPASKLLIDGLRVLIVDDNRTNRFVFGKYLETWNCKYDQAENGAIALRMLSENAERNIPYDVALIDFQMERMDGLKLAERIQENPQISSTRLILLSSVTDVIPRSEVLRRGFKHFLNKPVKLKELYDVIVSVTGNTEDKELKPAINSYGFPTNLSVLIAEDNPTNLKVAQLILKPFITAFDSAEDGLIAFEKFKTNKYDIIFMDVQMPVMNGYEATKCIRDYEIENNLTPVKIVAMTANAMKEDVEECFSSGMDEYLSKPFRRDDMIRIIGKLDI